MKEEKKNNKLATTIMMLGVLAAMISFFVGLSSFVLGSIMGAVVGHGGIDWGSAYGMTACISFICVIGFTAVAIYEKMVVDIAQKTVDSENGILWRERKRIWCGLPLSFTEYSLSEDRLFVETGFLNIEQNEVRLYRIRDLKLKRSFTQRIFGLGTIVLESTDASLKDFSLANIKDSERIKEKISQMVEKERTEKRVGIRDTYVINDNDDESGDDADMSL